MDSCDPVRPLSVLSLPYIEVYNHSCDSDPTSDEHMVESKRLYKMGVKSGAIDGDGIIVGVAKDWKRIASPPTTDKSSYSLIFWDSTNQKKPTSEKIVCNPILLYFILKSVT